MKRLLALAAVTVALTACSPAGATSETPPPAAADDIGTFVPAPEFDEDVAGYIAELHQYEDIYGYDIVEDFAEDDLVSEGRLVCGALALGQSREAIKDTFYANSSKAVSEGDAMSLVYAAEDYLCPDH